MGRRRFEKELADELEFHIDARAEHLIREGAAPAEARRRARLELGNLDGVKEAVRAERIGASLERLARETRTGARGLAGARGFTLVTTGTLAAGHPV